jgi:hypothetical protein
LADFVSVGQSVFCPGRAVMFRSHTGPPATFSIVIIAPIAQVARPDMAFRDAAMFEVAVAGLCQSSAGFAPTLGNRSNDTEKMKESA